MIRRILIYGLLLALPFILYWAWMAFVRRRQAEAGGVWNDAPLTWLLISGILLVLATLGATAFMSGSNPDMQYVPPSYEDGEVVPSRVE